MKRRDFLAAAAALPALPALMTSPELMAQTTHAGAAGGATTDWTCGVSNGVASLNLSVSGSAPSPFSLRGVCYSPCPINNSNAYGPNIGDWYWDSFSGTGYGITNWHALWERDLGNIRAMGVNTIRVYSMISRQFNSDGTLPSYPFTGQLFTHKEFLDACWNNGNNPVYVLVGIPLPDTMFWKDKHDEAPASVLDYWQHMLQETVGQVASHPAVLGFTIQNELDGADVCYNMPDKAEFWWGQVRKISGWVKAAMGNNKKLVGMATHDDPNIPNKASSYMEAVTQLDFWGVNSYQTASFDSIFKKDPNNVGYENMKGNALKPVILTEWGMPATSHSNPAEPKTIYADNTTIEASAALISKLVPQAFNRSKYPLSLGLYYFEYCDERWNQPGSPDISTWWGGTPNPGFPNGYWDQDGFGLYATARGGNLPNNAPTWSQNGGYGGPAMPIDVTTVRKAMVDALSLAFR
jgi:hypothetical protein